MCKNNCNSCNTHNKCDCHDPCDKNKVCGCSIELDTLCVTYTGNDILPLGITSGQNLTDILNLINDYLQFLLIEIENKSAIENIGGGVEVYSGRNEVTDANQLRTLVSSPTVIVTQIGDTISFEALGGGDVDISNIIENVGNSGLDIYKGFNTLTSKHEIKRITSPTTGAKVIYNNPSEPDNISQRSISSEDLTVVESGENISLSTEDINESVGGETEVYKGYINSKHQFRTFESTDQSVEISNDNDKVDFKVYNPVTNLGAFITLNIGGGTVGDTFEVRGDISSAELTFIGTTPSPQSEILVTLANPMINDDYFVRVHFQSLDSSSSSDAERFSFKPITRDHTANSFKLGLAKNGILNPNQSFLVVLEVVQSFFNFNIDPPNEEAEYQVAVGGCNNFDPLLATWQDIFTDDALNLSDGDIIYTDFAQTIPFNGSTFDTYRLRRKPSAGIPFLLDKSFSIGDGFLTTSGEVNALNACTVSTNEYEYVFGDCSLDTSDPALNWSPLYATRIGTLLTGQVIQEQDILYTDSGLTLALSNQTNLRVRTTSNSIAFNNTYNTGIFGDVGVVEECLQGLRLNGSLGEFTIKGAEPNEVITIEFNQCTSSDIGNPCADNSFTLPPLPPNIISLGLGVNTQSASFSTDPTGESSENYSTNFNSGNPTTGNITVTVTGRSSGLPTGQSAVIIVNE